jgi:organic radical activating enzyme
MKKIIRIRQPDDAPMHLTWMINNICQNSCSYCPSDLHDGKNHYYEWDEAKRFFEMLFERYPKIHCSVSGGEPSMSPFFKDICKTFHKAGHTIGLTSNAAKSPEYWSELAEYLNYVCFSWHPEFPDPKFAEKAIAAGSKKPTVVRIMMHPGHWDKCVEAYINFCKIEEVITEPVKIIDYNKIQSLDFTKNILKLEPLRKKFQSFGCNVKNINGHNFIQIYKSFFVRKNKKPTVIIANTIKGKGVSFMENSISWHYKYPNLKELEVAIKEIQL